MKKLTKREQIELKKFAYTTARMLRPNYEQFPNPTEWVDWKAEQIYNWLINNQPLHKASSISLTTTE